jgi:hypothetical protein
MAQTGETMETETRTAGMQPKKFPLPLILGAVGALVAVGVGLWLTRGYWLGRGVAPPPTIPAASEREKVPVPEIRFASVAAAWGISFRHTAGMSGKKLLPETMGSGVACFDFDGDGKQDILFVNSRPWPGRGDGPPPTMVLYRNVGGKFEDVTTAAGLAVPLYGMGVSCGDYDNDGRTDVFVTAVGGNRLFRNVDGKHFEDATTAAGVGGPDQWPAGTFDDFLTLARPLAFPSSATWLDYDNDGKLDLFVCHYVTWSPAIDLGISATLEGVGRAFVPPTGFEGSQCVLYRNVDGRKFEDVSASAGVQVWQQNADGRRQAVGKSLGVVACDPDDDGWQDLVVANDTVRNFFFHNIPDGSGGRKFEEIGLAAGVAYAEGRARGGMGIDYGEFRPGKPAVLIANFANEPATFLGLDNAKKLLFSDVALAAGLAGPSRGPLKFGAFFFDYDLDGRLDLLTCNGHLEPDIAKVQASQTWPQPPQLFWNAGKRGRAFEPVTPAEAGNDLFQPIVGRGSAFADLDGDGDLDLVLAVNDGAAEVFRNDLPAGKGRLRLVLEGDGKRTNRPAIGASVTVECGGLVQRRQVTAGRGYLSQSELPVTFGLGTDTGPVKVTVRWPGKETATEEWPELQPGRTYRLRQGFAPAEVLP